MHCIAECEDNRVEHRLKGRNSNLTTVDSVVLNKVVDKLISTVLWFRFREFNTEKVVM